MRADVIIFDGKNHLYRATDAFKGLYCSIGGNDVPTGGVYGFLKIATRSKEKYGGKSIVAWEGGDNFRKKIFPSYKKRGEFTEDQLALFEGVQAQEGLLVMLLKAMGVTQYEGVGCEADDVIGRLATMYASKGKSVAICSGDSDLRQLVTDSIHVVSPGNNKSPEKRYSPSSVQERHGVEPSLISDLKAIAGDSSDAIPGVKGIGEKTAAILLSHYGGLEAVIKAAESGDKNWPVANRHVEAICNSKNEIEIYHSLTKIRTNLKLKKIKAEPDSKKTFGILRRLGFRTFASPQSMTSLMRLGR